VRRRSVESRRLFGVCPLCFTRSVESARKEMAGGVGGEWFVEAGRDGDGGGRGVVAERGSD
jgi:hypothetical protein